MIPRPTTPDLIADCCRELSEHILPALTSDPDRVRLAMIETVLRNAAVRAAHEIAWLQDETTTLVDYARLVLDRHSDAALAHSIETVGAGTSLHLDDVISAYELAGRAFEQALAAAQHHGSTDLVRAARDLLRHRIATEKQVMATYAIVGR